MAIFDITVLYPPTQEKKQIVYDSSFSTLKWKSGEPVLANVKIQPDVVTPAKINHGKKSLGIIKIQLGLSCNFECEYCSQRFVPHADSTDPDDVQPFVDGMDKWFEGGSDGFGAGTHFEFWGGEPFVYWKTFKPLAEAIIKKYPNATKSTISNGSLIDNEKIDWLERYDFSIGISHDGPGQYVRGPDPLNDPKSKAAIIELFKRRAPKNKMSFNSMINSKNASRAAIEKYFVNFVTENLGEKYLQFLKIGEGGFIDAYDDGGLANSLLDDEEENIYRIAALSELREGKVKRFMTVNQKIQQFINSIINGDRIEALPQKCGMDQSSNITVDLNGNVLTCQNVSAVSKNPAGFSHKVGHISDLENVKLTTATHWSDRKECPNCPVIHICRGACLFLSGPLWEASCNNSYSDNILEFCTGIEEMTGGWLPIYIDGPLREDRKDIFWWTNGKPEKTRKAKKIIPIMAV